MQQVDISLGFMPAFFHKHVGVTYGEAYYFDPGYRAEVECAEGRYLYDVLGRFGVGSPQPQPWPNIFVQPVDLVMRTQGAAWRFPADATVESVGTPWAALSPEEIARIDAQEAAHHPVLDELLAQYHVLERLYGESADIFSVKSGMMNIHTPYTTAHQLCGEELFVTMLLDPEGAQAIFAKVWQIYQAIFARISAVTGARLTRVQLGDCSAAMLSVEVYREVVLPVNQAIAKQFSVAGYHSCGSSSHLLPAFSTLPRLANIQLGPGTNLTDSAALLPGVKLEPLVDPLLLRNAEAEEVGDTITAMLHATAPAPATTLCAWSFDRETPIENVAAMYTAVEEFKQRSG